MQKLQIALFYLMTLIFINPALAANVRATLAHAGFFGKVSLGISYEFSDQHAADISLGGYEISDHLYYQLNLAYRYSPWTVPFGKHQWRPIQTGIFAVYSLDHDRYFFKSPGKYPYDNYYEQTILRYGVEFSSTMTFLPYNVAISYHVRVFETGVIANFNNQHKDLEFYISSGVSLQYLF